MAAMEEARRELQIETKPVLVGPLTFLHLSKKPAGADQRDLLRQAGKAYGALISELSKAGARWIQLDEPALILEETSPHWAAMEEAYREMARAKGDARLLLTTYYGDVAEAWPTLLDLPVDALGLDFVRGERNREMLLHSGFPENKTLVAGLLDGRNIWRTDLSAALDLVEAILERIPQDRLLLAPSCNLFHLPYSVERESALDPRLIPWLAFAQDRLTELAVLKRCVQQGRQAISSELDENRRLLEDRARSPLTENPEVRERTASLSEDAFRRTDFSDRRPMQEKELGLPSLPTTTIGSFPQTGEVRKARSRFKAGKLDAGEYRAFIDEKIRDVIRLQEEVGLDVLVHGEFERADMVEYFAEQLEGMAITKHAWVQSYGTRYVRPPIIYGDIRRSAPLSVREVAYAQSLTSRPVKGMLTGPVTIQNWSFPRPDMSREDVAYQIALALRDETRDLEEAGIRVIQIDEPAFREGFPLKRAEWANYLRWAVRAFRLSSGGVRTATQIHSHMCYSDFKDIIDAIAEMDADVLSLENSRSPGELLEAFERYGYPRWVGPGVYDVHSERVPPVDEMVELIQRSARVLPQDHLWVNPDCGLKTRNFEEVTPSLANMVKAAQQAREASATRKAREG
ncbi:MAG: 5-methyltetrahydropteroyltriglutamate--homocysteine S-methyltransferase [Candidatus Eisenbacteria bacterium]|nr:5-methyltetrahydropteroyltriglutamate--homocysteine S-methyltransferase [Candidatus Eisenbacteria bacterium]